MDTLSGMPKLVPQLTFTVTLTPDGDGHAPLGNLPLLRDCIRGLGLDLPFDSQQVITFMSRIDTTIRSQSVITHGGDTLVAFASIAELRLWRAGLRPADERRPDQGPGVGLSPLRTDFTTVCGDSAAVTATKPR